MNRSHFAVAVVLTAMTAGIGRADLIQIPAFTNVPSSYTPGTPFQFEITAPLLTNSGNPVSGIQAFNIDLLFTATNASTNLTVSAAQPGADYIFPGSTSFTSIASPGQTANQVYLQFSDSIGTNSISTSSSNYIFGVVTVTPGVNLTGNLEIQYFYSTYNSSNGAFTPTVVEGSIMEGNVLVQRPNQENLTQNQGPSPACAGGWYHARHRHVDSSDAAEIAPVFIVMSPLHLG